MVRYGIFNKKILSFDGVDDYVNCGNPVVTGTFSVEALVKVLDTNIRDIVGTRSPTDYSFDIKFKDGNTIHGDIGSGSGWITNVADASFDYKLDTWYDVVYMVTPTGYTIYVNGNQVGSGSYTEDTPVFSDANHEIAIGNSAVTGGEYFYGDIALVRTYNRALTQSEINQNFTNGFEATSITNGLVLELIHSTIDEVNSLWDDNSGNGNNGTIYGAKVIYT